jgi:iron-sulfur cluster assembly protein
MDITLQLTDRAADYIKTMLQKNNNTAFRLSIKKTGCSGYSYKPEMVNEINPNDTRLEMKGITLLIDTLWLHLLNGVQIDYIEEEKSGLKQKHLVFNNPNESGRCGCGESFHAP